MLTDLTLITTHFHEFGWIECWIKQIDKYTDRVAIREILVIDQDRSPVSHARIQRLDSRIRVLQYPKSEAHFAVMGHDHPAVMNAAISEARGKYICIFDSDAHPVNRTWVQHCEHLLEAYDAILATYDAESGYSHPCFMLFKREHTNIPLSFDEKLFTDGIDTGRLIGSQLRNANQRVYLAEPTPAFSGYHGSIYLQSIYHHGQGSFHGAGKRLTNQTNWGNEYFRKRVIKDGSYSLSIMQKVYYRLAMFVLYGIRRRIRRYCDYITHAMRSSGS